MQQFQKQTAPIFLAGDGEMAELTRNFNWAESSLGLPDQWPVSLQVTVGIVLHSAFPMFLFWGNNLVSFYNDAFRASLGNDGKHPAVGKNAKEVWGDIWEQISPWIYRVMETGKPVFFEDQLVPFYRNGRQENIFWTFSYSPAYGEHGINGVFVTCFETTEKISTLKKLEDSKRQFQNLVREATVGIIVLMGQEKRIKIVNEAYGKLIGKSPGELQDQLLWDIVPEAAAHFDPLLEKVRISGEPLYLYDYPYFFFEEGRRVDGHLNIVYQPYKEEDGTITGIMALCQNATAQVKDHKRVKESEQKVRAIVDSAPFPIGVYTGREMRIELANKSIMDVWGKGYDVVGKLYSEILPELSNQKIFSQLEQVYATGIPFHARGQMLYLVVDNKLQPFYFNYSFTPLYDTEGNIYGVMNTAAEVTDLYLTKQKIEQSEKNLRNMVLQAPVAMCILLGADHIVEVANEPMIEIWGKESASVLGKPIFEALPDAKEQGLEEVMKHVYVSGETFRASEHPVSLLRKGKWDTVYQNFVYQPYKDGDGTILGVIAISVDVTQQVLARQKIEEVVALRTKELAEANENLRRSNEELAQFAYIASHDLQEPVRKVSTFIQMLDSELPVRSERAGHYIEKIKNSSARMLTLIRDVLSYSQLSRDADVVSRIDLNDVLQDVTNDFELLIAQKGATISYSGLPCINAIPLQMSQLFGNLISNSLKFAKAGITPEITVTCDIVSNAGQHDLPTSMDPDKPHYHIIVKDNGIGFSSEHAENIFNIFQRLHGKKEYEGTGIGLATCRKIVQNHGGNIYATSAKNEGASFHILLPS